MDSLDKIVAEYIEKFLEGNRVGRDLAQRLDDCGIGLMPLLDHCTIRTLDVDLRARQFMELGYTHDATIGVLEFENWWAKVYRKPGYPTLFIDQAFDGPRGEKSLITNWVKHHGDQCFHHLAIRVENIEDAVSAIQQRGFDVAGDIIGVPGSDLRQVFSLPEMRNGHAYTVLEFIERHNGYSGFLPPQADGLMESTRAN